MENKEKLIELLNSWYKYDMHTEVIAEEILDLFKKQLINFANYCETEWSCPEIPINVIDSYLNS